MYNYGSWSVYLLNQIKIFNFNIFGITNAVPRNSGKDYFIGFYLGPEVGLIIKDSNNHKLAKGYIGFNSSLNQSSHKVNEFGADEYSTWNTSQTNGLIEILQYAAANHKNLIPNYKVNFRGAFLLGASSITSHSSSPDRDSLQRLINDSIVKLGHGNSTNTEGVGDYTNVYMNKGGELVIYKHSDIKISSNSTKQQIENLNNLSNALSNKSVQIGTRNEPLGNELREIIRKGIIDPIQNDLKSKNATSGGKRVNNSKLESATSNALFALTRDVNEKAPEGEDLILVRDKLTFNMIHSSDYALLAHTMESMAKDGVANIKLSDTTSFKDQLREADAYEKGFFEDRVYSFFTSELCEFKKEIGVNVGSEPEAKVSGDAENYESYVLNLIKNVIIFEYLKNRKSPDELFNIELDTFYNFFATKQVEQLKEYAGNDSELVSKFIKSYISKYLFTRYGAKPFQKSLNIFSFMNLLPEVENPICINDKLMLWNKKDMFKYMPIAKMFTFREVVEFNLEKLLLNEESPAEKINREVSRFREENVINKKAPSLLNLYENGAVFIWNLVLGSRFKLKEPATASVDEIQEFIADRIVLLNLLFETPAEKLGSIKSIILSKYINNTLDILDKLVKDRKILIDYINYVPGTNNMVYLETADLIYELYFGFYKYLLHSSSCQEMRPIILHRMASVLIKNNILNHHRYISNDQYTGLPETRLKPDDITYGMAVRHEFVLSDEIFASVSAELAAKEKTEADAAKLDYAAKVKAAVAEQERVYDIKDSISDVMKKRIGRVVYDFVPNYSTFVFLADSQKDIVTPRYIDGVVCYCEDPGLVGAANAPLFRGTVEVANDNIRITMQDGHIRSRFNLQTVMAMNYLRPTIYSAEGYFERGLAAVGGTKKQVEWIKGAFTNAYNILTGQKEKEKEDLLENVRDVQDQTLGASLDYERVLKARVDLYSKLFYGHETRYVESDDFRFEQIVGKTTIKNDVLDLVSEKLKLQTDDSHRALFKQFTSKIVNFGNNNVSVNTLQNGLNLLYYDNKISDEDKHHLATALNHVEQLVRHDTPASMEELISSTSIISYDQAKSALWNAAGMLFNSPGALDGVDSDWKISISENHKYRELFGKLSPYLVLFRQKEYVKSKQLEVLELQDQESFIHLINSARILHQNTISRAGLLRDYMELTSKYMFVTVPLQVNTDDPTRDTGKKISNEIQDWITHAHKHLVRNDIKHTTFYLNIPECAYLENSLIEAEIVNADDLEKSREIVMQYLFGSSESMDGEGQQNVKYVLDKSLYELRGHLIESGNAEAEEIQNIKRMRNSAGGLLYDLLAPDDVFIYSVSVGQGQDSILSIIKKDTIKYDKFIDQVVHRSVQITCSDIEGVSPTLLSTTASKFANMLTAYAGPKAELIGNDLEIIADKVLKHSLLVQEYHPELHIANIFLQVLAEALLGHSDDSLNVIKKIFNGKSTEGSNNFKLYLKPNSLVHVSITNSPTVKAIFDSMENINQLRVIEKLKLVPELYGHMNKLYEMGGDGPTIMSARDITNNKNEEFNFPASMPILLAYNLLNLRDNNSGYVQEVIYQRGGDKYVLDDIIKESDLAFNDKFMTLSNSMLYVADSILSADKLAPKGFLDDKNRAELAKYIQEFDKILPAATALKYAEFAVPGVDVIPNIHDSPRMAHLNTYIRRVNRLYATSSPKLAPLYSTVYSDIVLSEKYSELEDRIIINKFLDEVYAEILDKETEFKHRAPADVSKNVDRLNNLLQDPYKVMENEPAMNDVVQNMLDYSSETIHIINDDVSKIVMNTEDSQVSDYSELASNMVAIFSNRSSLRELEHVLFMKEIDKILDSTVPNSDNPFRKLIKTIANGDKSESVDLLLTIEAKETAKNPMLMLVDSRAFREEIKDNTQLDKEDIELFVNFCKELENSIEKFMFNYRIINNVVTLANKLRRIERKDDEFYNKECGVFHSPEGESEESLTSLFTASSISALVPQEELKELRIAKTTASQNIVTICHNYFLKVEEYRKAKNILSSLEVKKTNAEKPISELEAKKANAKRLLKELKDKRKANRDNPNPVKVKRSELDATSAEIGRLEAELAEAKEKFNKAQQDFDNGKVEFDKAQQDLDNGKVEFSKQLDAWKNDLNERVESRNILVSNAIAKIKGDYESSKYQQMLYKAIYNLNTVDIRSLINIDLSAQKVTFTDEEVNNYNLVKAILNSGYKLEAIFNNPDILSSTLDESLIGALGVSKESRDAFVSGSLDLCSTEACVLHMAVITKLQHELIELCLLRKPGMAEEPEDLGPILHQLVASLSVYRNLYMNSYTAFKTGSDRLNSLKVDFAFNNVDMENLTADNLVLNDGIYKFANIDIEVKKLPAHLLMDDNPKISVSFDNTNNDENKNVINMLDNGLFTNALDSNVIYSKILEKFSSEKLNKVEDRGLSEVLSSGFDISDYTKRKVAYNIIRNDYLDRDPRIFEAISQLVFDFNETNVPNYEDNLETISGRRELQNIVLRYRAFLKSKSVIKPTFEDFANRSDEGKADLEFVKNHKINSVEFVNHFSDKIYPKYYSYLRNELNYESGQYNDIGRYVITTDHTSKEITRELRSKLFDDRTLIQAIGDSYCKMAEAAMSNKNIKSQLDAMKAVEISTMYKLTNTNKEFIKRTSGVKYEADVELSNEDTTLFSLVLPNEEREEVRRNLLSSTLNLCCNNLFYNISEIPISSLGFIYNALLEIMSLESAIVEDMVKKWFLKAKNINSDNISQITSGPFEYAMGLLEGNTHELSILKNRIEELDNKDENLIRTFIRAGFNYGTINAAEFSASSTVSRSAILGAAASLLHAISNSSQEAVIPSTLRIKLNKNHVDLALLAMKKVTDKSFYAGVFCEGSVYIEPDVAPITGLIKSDQLFKYRVYCRLGLQNNLVKYNVLLPKILYTATLGVGIELNTDLVFDPHNSFITINDKQVYINAI